MLSIQDRSIGHKSQSPVKNPHFGDFYMCARHGRHKPVIFELVEYTLTKPGAAEDFRDFARSKITDSIGRIGVNSATFVMDTGEADNMRRTLNMLAQHGISVVYSCQSNLVAGVQVIPVSLFK